MNIYFQETLTELKSEEFISELKATGSLVLRLLRLIFLLLGSLAIFIRDVYIYLTKAIEEQQLDNLSIEQIATDNLNSELFINLTLDNEQEFTLLELTTIKEPLMITAPKEATAPTTDSELVEAVNVPTTIKQSRKAQLRLLKAGDLKQLTNSYLLNYQNKSQAIQDILNYEATLEGI
ncbi:hypothetical protein LC613_28740 [Nostoc sphaeroides CHAB 2801]|uniref:hypothetical protein n=1 Tax=Nostoc sphaeroides TaxID=446679 RepID=UPI000E53E3DD|nr:hypothetical protein [Nostoc sphaeroides]MCC5631708.1 hypothetical protein [Nostoc sphaeroides CHAB 2801]